MLGSIASTAGSRILNLNAGPRLWTVQPSHTRPMHESQCNGYARPYHRYLGLLCLDCQHFALFLAFLDCGGIKAIILSYSVRQ